MAWIGDSFFSWPWLSLRCTVNCPEDASTVRHDFREIGPTMTFAPPRIWENILSQAQVRIEMPTGFSARSRTSFSLAACSRPSSSWKPGGARGTSGAVRVGRWLVFEPLRDQLASAHSLGHHGRGRPGTRDDAVLPPSASISSSSTGHRVLRSRHLHRDGQVKLETVAPAPRSGREAFPGGEVLIRCGGLFSGYYKSPEQTAAALRDGCCTLAMRAFRSRRPSRHHRPREDVAKLDDGASSRPSTSRTSSSSACTSRKR